ncbi:hypothetical protein CEXT_618641 [Caerostris extrusa]|uniref:Uncharacterized protein n=1 Tax=Caerostris extrusa TaxID=172846 RepID=A0AAV4MR93_CAEEX|nr:hypothetical protein CEXT_618641 [Caerostris extrusa]
MSFKSRVASGKTKLDKYPRHYAKWKRIGDQKSSDFLSLVEKNYIRFPIPLGRCTEILEGNSTSDPRRKADKDYNMHSLAVNHTTNTGKSILSIYLVIGAHKKNQHSKAKIGRQSEKLFSAAD